MSEIKRVHVWDPALKKNYFKSFSLKKYTAEEIEKKSAEWKEEMRKKIAERGEPTVLRASPSTEGSPPWLPFEGFLEMLPPENPKDGISIIIMGSTKSGKTHLLLNLMKGVFSKHLNVLFSQSLHNPKYSELVEKYPSSDRYIPEVVKQCYKINKNSDNAYKFNIILDDVIGEQNDKEIGNLLMIYRNSNLSAVIVGQDRTIINAKGRGNVNHLCFFNLITDSRVEACIKEFLGSYFPPGMKMDDMIKLYRKLTADHHFLYLNALDGKLYRTKAPPLD